jgi:hypothetical protein
MRKFRKPRAPHVLLVLAAALVSGCERTADIQTRSDALESIDAQLRDLAPEASSTTADSAEDGAHADSAVATEPQLIAAPIDNVIPQKQQASQSSSEPADTSVSIFDELTTEPELPAATIYELLERIREETRDEHTFLEDRSARRARQALASWQASDGFAKLWQLHATLGIKEVILGNEIAGIDQLGHAYELIPEVRGQIGNREADETLFQSAVAHLRYGETQNCCARNTPDSCIVPIRGEGIHTRRDGSVAAIKYLDELLANPKVDPERAVTARWLLNIAYMTLGGYPELVPKEHLVPPEMFGAGQEFPRFPNIASKLGVDTFNLCGGAVIDDFNGDGYLDIFTTTYDPAGEPHLFISDGSSGFTERSQEAGLKGLYGGLNAIQADYDNDGDVDILILRGAWLRNAGRHPDSLLANDGQGNFTDVTFEAGLAKVHYPTHSAAWGDYDNDGDLDLYIGNESTSAIRAPSQLFRNNGDRTFTDVASDAGVENLRFAKGVVWGDYDGDRFPDLYVSNLGQPNRLYHNNRDGTFTDVAARANVEQPLNGFPCWFWDFNNDGALDIYAASYSSRMNAVASYYVGRTTEFEPPCLYRGDGRGGFEDVTAQYGLNRPMLPMGANFGDLNNDGYLDFYLGTGDPDYWSLMPNLCFVNRDGQAFEDVTMAAGLGHLQKGHGVSFADLDNDGDLDIFEQMGGAFRGDAFNDCLYENPGFGNGWIAIDLVGKRSNRSAIGVRLRAEVIYPDGSIQSVYRNLDSGGSFGANPLRQTIGLGKNGKLRILEVFWPTTNETQRFENLPAGGFIRITEGDNHVDVRNLTALRFP